MQQLGIWRSLNINAEPLGMWKRTVVWIPEKAHQVLCKGLGSMSHCGQSTVCCCT